MDRIIYRQIERHMVNKEINGQTNAYTDGRTDRLENETAVRKIDNEQTE
jgi:hypothetical protein